MIYIGCHLSNAGGYMAMGRQATELDADTFAYFTRNPRGGKAKAVDEADAAAFMEYTAARGFGPLVAHAPYTLNPCSKDEKTREFARMVFEDDLKRMEYTPGNLYNFHPGSHVGQGTEVGISYIAELLNTYLWPEMTTTVLLETMAGKGSEVGGRFEELAEIIARMELDEKLGVCLDTCHVYDGGYDIVNDLDGVLTEFDRIVGLKRLRAIHINDSKNPFGSHKDRHERLGEGSLGMEALTRVVNHPSLQGLPFILETPNELDGYKAEIAAIRSVMK